MTGAFSPAPAQVLDLLGVTPRLQQPGTFAVAAPEMPRRVRVLSYNLHSGRGPEPWDENDACAGAGPDGDRWLSRVADLVVREEIDVVLLQEVLQTTRCIPGKSQSAYLADRLGYHREFCVAVTSQSNVILSRWPLTAVRKVQMDVPGAMQNRCAVLARAAIPGQPNGVWLASTHLDQQESGEAREKQVARLRPHLEELDAPLLLAADMNAEPGSQPVEALQQIQVQSHRLRDTWPQAGEGSAGTTGSGDRKIDFVFATAPIKAVNSRVLDAGLSDHRALRATLELPPAP